MASRTDSRFSTYSGAPSLQPSLAPTYESSNRSSIHAKSTRTSSQQTYLNSTKSGSGSEKGRNSVYASNDPASSSATASSSTLASNDPKAADLKSWSGALERMQDERLEKQRYVMSGNKSDEVSKLALGAKLERALSRRMVGQDASFPKKNLDREKRNLEVEAN